MAEVISKNGRKMSSVATRTVTPVKDSSPKAVSVDAKQQKRRAENAEFLKNKNVKAFLDTLAQVEGGNYHAKFGMVGQPAGNPESGHSVTSLLTQDQVMVVQLQLLEGTKSQKPHGRNSPSKQWGYLTSAPERRT